MHNVPQPRTVWQREQLVCTSHAGRNRVQAWLAGLEVERARTALYHLKNLLDSMGYKFNSEQRDAVRADIEYTESMLNTWLCKRKSAWRGRMQ